MKERPILFSSEMVRAILDGRKTQTRRLLKWQPIDVLPMKTKNEWVTLDTKEPEAHGKIIHCRYGIPGDRLWVRETFTIPYLVGNYKGKCDYFKSQRVLFKSDCGKQFYTIGGNYSFFENECKWKPSIFMPRWASRINLEIVNIRIQKLMDITEEDIKSEGTKPFDNALYPYHLSFFTLWDSINDKNGFGVKTNPWVWVIEFKRIDNG